MLDPPDAKLFLEQFLRGELPYPNTANTALAWHHGKLLALWEGGPPHEIKVPSLETVGPYTFGGKLKHAFTAHPKVDPKTGELMFFGYSLAAPVCAVQRRRSRRRHQEHHAHRAAAAGDDARHGDHGEVQPVHRLSGGLRSRGHAARQIDS